MILDILAAHDEAFATLVAAFIAILVAWIAYRQNRRRHIKEYTLSVLAPLLTNEKLFTAHNLITDRAIAGELLSYNELAKPERELVLQLLSYYEFLAAAFLRRDIDRQTVMRQRKSSFVSAYKVSKPFIEERRRLLNRPLVYCELEKFVTRYCK